MASCFKAVFTNDILSSTLKPKDRAVVPIGVLPSLAEEDGGRRDLHYWKLGWTSLLVALAGATQLYASFRQFYLLV
jgi:hypothetical protein